MKLLADRTRLLAAALLFVAASIHAVASFEPDHLETQLFYVFWGIVIVQVAVGLLVLARVPAGPALGLIVNVLVIAAYTLSRLMPLPGEEMPEPVELLGLLSKVVELATLPFLYMLIRPAPEASTPTITPKAT